MRQPSLSKETERRNPFYLILAVTLTALIHFCLFALLNSYAPKPADIDYQITKVQLVTLSPSLPEPTQPPAAEPTLPEPLIEIPPEPLPQEPQPETSPAPPPDNEPSAPPGNPLSLSKRHLFPKAMSSSQNVGGCLLGHASH